MFHFLITPYLINIAYILGVIFPFFLIYYFYDYLKFIVTKKYKYKFKIILGIVFMILMYEVMLRIFFEFIIVYFNMYDELKAINNKL